MSETLKPTPDSVSTCRHCGGRIVLVNYAMGPSWTHQPAGAAFQDGQHQFCHRTRAEPPEPAEASRVWGVAEAADVTHRTGKLHRAARSYPRGPSKRNRAPYRTRCGQLVHRGAPFDPATVPASETCTRCFPATKPGA